MMVNVRRYSCMEIPASRWYPAIARRRSKRRYESRPLGTDTLTQLQTVLREFKPFPETRSVLVSHSPEDVFKGAIGSYGKVKGAPGFVAFIGNTEDPHIHEKIGYLGEGIILEATALQLGTCWVGGMFRREVAGRLIQIQRNEKFFAVTPIGYPREGDSLGEKMMKRFVKSHLRKPLNELAKGMEEAKWPFWIKDALEAARVSPSAVNRQPWRFSIGPDAITLSVDDLKDTFHISKRLDCGIAMMHLEVAALIHGKHGWWELLGPPAVARFRVE